MLKDHQDALGHAMLDYLNGIMSYEIVERDDGYIQPEVGAKVYFRTYREWSIIERKASRYIKGRILDVGCGAGRHALYFQEKGHEVLGIDNSPLAIEVCRKRGLKNAEAMSINQISSRLGIFDTILMLGGNFGLFGSLEKAKLLLARFAKITSKTGRIIAISADPYQLEYLKQPNYIELNRERDRMSGQLRVRGRYKTYITPWFDFLLVSKDEMTHILDGTAWRIQKFIDSGSARYTAVIHKRKS